VRAFEDYLLPAEAGRNTGIDGETDPGRYIVSRTAALGERHLQPTGGDLWGKV
jgi:hypothetical protein